jgi:hypothetical protein
VLRATGVSSIEHHLTTFEQLLPGVQEGRWDMNVPLFVTTVRTTSMPSPTASTAGLVPHTHSTRGSKSSPPCSHLLLAPILQSTKHCVALHI